MPSSKTRYGCINWLLNFLLGKTKYIDPFEIKVLVISLMIGPRGKS